LSIFNKIESSEKRKKEKKKERRKLEKFLVLHKNCAFSRNKRRGNE
jgi:hypothetical protein